MKNIIYISDFYLEDKRLLESIGKAIKFSGETFVLILDGRRYSNPNSSSSELSVPIVSDVQFIENISKNVYGVIGKRLISFFSEAPVASVSLTAEMRSLITKENDFYKINHSLIDQLLASKTNLILTTCFPDQRLYLSPFFVLDLFQRQNFNCFILDENLPPDGISTFREFSVWVESEPEKLSNYFWLNEWPAGSTFHFINLLKLKEFATSKNRHLAIKK